ncbi:MAG: hypothetical protein AAGB31_06695 [Bdellovibrio sp.]
MKTISLFLILLVAHSYSSANSVRYTCRSQDHSVTFSEYEFVSVTQDPQTQFISLQNLLSKKIAKKEWHFLSKKYADSVVGSLLIDKTSAKRTLAQEGGEPCSGGYTGGFETTEYSLQGVLTLQGQSKAISFQCTEMLSFSGRCHD